jgi:membrane protein YqaA with SNARE-associated domain
MGGYYIGASLGVWDAGCSPSMAMTRRWTSFTPCSSNGDCGSSIKGMTPIPYKVVTIASGMAAFDFKVFIIASVATRGARFFLVAGLLYLFGEPVREFIERRLTLVTTLFVVLVVGGFVALNYIF